MIAQLAIAERASIPWQLIEAGHGGGAIEPHPVQCMFGKLRHVSRGCITLAADWLIARSPDSRDAERRMESS